MATTWSSRQDARIRYTAPAVADGRSTSVTEIDLYRSLEETLGPPGLRPGVREEAVVPLYQLHVPARQYPNAGPILRYGI